MSNPKYDNYREYHERLTWRDLEMTFGAGEEGDLSDFEQWARYEEDLEDAYLLSNKT